MGYQNRLKIDLALHDLSEPLREHMNRVFSNLRLEGRSWVDLLKDRDSERGMNAQYFEDDPALLLRMITDILVSPAASREPPPPDNVLQAARRLRHIRNAWAHHNPISDFEVRRAEDDCRKILRWTRSVGTSVPEPSPQEKILQRARRVSGSPTTESPVPGPSSSRHMGRESIRAGRPKSTGTYGDAAPREEHLTDYLDNWWHRALKSGPTEITKGLIPLLTVAFGPLSDTDLRGLSVDINPIGHAGTIDTARWLINGTPEDGYTLAAPIFVEYFVKKLKHDELDRAKRRLLEYSAAWSRNKSIYAIANYPLHLADTSLDALPSLYESFLYVEEAVRILGIDAVIGTLKIILETRNISKEVRLALESFLRMLDREAHHLRMPFPLHENGYVARQVAIQALGSSEAGLLEKALAYLESSGSNHLTPLSSPDPASPQLLRTLYCPPDDLGSRSWGKITADSTRAVTGDGAVVRLWELSTGKLLRTLRGHKGWVSSGALTPDGTRLLTGSLDHTARLWDMSTGSTIHVLNCHVRDVSTFALTADGTRAITAGAGGAVRVWNLETGELIRVQMSHISQVAAMAVTPDGSRAVTGDDNGNVRVWELETGRAISAHKGDWWNIKAIDVLPDGRRAVVADATGTVRVLDLDTCATVEWMVGPDGYHLEGMALTATGSRLVAVYEKSSRVVIRPWDLESDVVLPDVIAQDTFSVNRVAITPDGVRVVVAGSDGSASVNDLHSGRTISLLNHAARFVWDVDVTAGGSQALTTGDDAAFVWNLDVSEVLEDRSNSPEYGPVTDIRITNSGVVVSASADGTARAWNLEDSQDIQVLRHFQYQDIAPSIALSATGNSALISGRGRQLGEWKLDSGRVQRHILGDQSFPDDVWAWSSLMSSNGTQVVTGGDNYTAIIWDLREGKLLQTLAGHTGHLIAVEISPHGDLVVTASYDGSVRIWDTQSGKALRVLAGDSEVPLQELTLSKDWSHLAALNWAGTVRIWETRGGRLIKVATTSVPSLGQLDDGQTGGGLRAIALSPDGHLAVTTGVAGVPHVYHLSSGRQELLRGHHGEVNSVSLTPDGLHAVTAGTDGTVRLWDIASGREACAVAVPSAVSCLCAAQTTRGTAIVCGQISGALMAFTLNTRSAGKR